MESKTMQHGAFFGGEKRGNSGRIAVLNRRRWRDSRASDFPLRGAGKSDKGIGQCLHWSMKATCVACGHDSNLSTPCKKKKHPEWGAFLLEKVSRFARIMREGVHRLFRGVHIVLRGCKCKGGSNREDFIIWHLDSTYLFSKPLHHVFHLCERAWKRVSCNTPAPCTEADFSAVHSRSKQ